jgi:hypothetical protein
LRPTVIVIAAAGLATGLAAQDAREIVRRSVELDQANWLRMQDYTWLARSSERHFDSGGKVKSTEGSAWETVMLDGEPYRRRLERDDRPLPPAERKKQRENWIRARPSSPAKHREKSGAGWRTTKRVAARSARFCARYRTPSTFASWEKFRWTATARG